MISRRCRPILTAALTIPLLFCGCRARTPAEKLAGHWHGTQNTGTAAASSEWQFNPDGTETASLSLPHGALTAQGTWRLEAGILTLRTTSRSIVFDGLQKKMILENPMEAAYQYVLAGDTLRLTRPETQETIVLTRSAE